PQNKSFVIISIFAGVLLISAVLMFLGPETADGADAALSFYKRHVNKGMTEDQCTDVIKNRGINEEYNEKINQENKVCKPTNTFLNGKNADSTGTICCSREGGELWPQNHKFKISKAIYPLVECKRDKVSQYPDCVYKGETYTDRRIIVSCTSSKDGGTPYHIEVFSPPPLVLLTRPGIHPDSLHTPPLAPHATVPTLL
uniref:Ribonuclease A-domain domain-containing protein n=1 Tax=Sander lucioperca TaxID=283035 RepID=A0A8C9Y066_SANLU